MLQWWLSFWIASLISTLTYDVFQTYSTSTQSSHSCQIYQSSFLPYRITTFHLQDRPPILRKIRKLLVFLRPCEYYSSEFLNNSEIVWSLVKRSFSISNSNFRPEAKRMNAKVLKTKKVREYKNECSKCRKANGVEVENSLLHFFLRRKSNVYIFGV